MANFPAPEPQNSNLLPSFAATTTGGATCFDACSLQTLDNHTASSILEFIVRQRVIPDYVVNAVFLNLPLANPISPSLKKVILFRRLASELAVRSVSERTLKILELIEEVDRESGSSPPSEAMKAAYCAVASSCTAAALRQNVDDFFDSFHRIWVLRICDIEKSAASALISEELREVRDIFWEVVKDPELRALVVNIDLEETLDLVRDYLEEVWDTKPLFPEVAVDAIEKDLRDPGERRNFREGLSGLKKQRFRCAEHTELEHLLKEIDMEVVDEIGEPIIESDSESDGQLDQGEGLAINVEKEQDLKANDLDGQRMVQDTFFDPGNKATELLAENLEQACNEEFKGNDGQKTMDELTSDSAIGSKDTGSEGKASDVDDEQALESSYPNLQVMVQNTLSDAVNKAIELPAENPEETCNEESRGNDCQSRRDELASASEIGAEDTSIDGKETRIMLNKYLEPSCLKGMDENQSWQNVSASMASFEKVPDITPDGENHTQNNSNLVSPPKTSLMERNPTAHTFERTDSPPLEGRFHLRSPKREAVSPLKLIDGKRYAKRRKIRKWTLLEEETLLKAVREHGKGSWKVILSTYPNIFEERNEVDLKDKWRNMTKSNGPS